MAQVFRSSVWAIVLLWWSVSGWAAESLAVQLDSAAALIKARRYDAGLAILLKQSPPEKKDDPKWRRYHTLVGLAYFGLKQYPRARAHLERAAEGGEDPLLFVYLAQVYHHLRDPEAALRAIDRAGKLVEKYPGLYEIKAQSLWELGKKSLAWAVLSEARARFPKQDRFLKRQIRWLLEQGLYVQAAEMGLAHLAALSDDPRDYAVLGNALRKAGRFGLAAQVLEQGRLRHPHSLVLAKLLAHVYLSQGKPLAAAGILEQAAYEDAKLYADAAEAYRRAGDFTHALYLNAQIPDTKVQRRQKVALLLALRRYEAVLAMARSLARSGLLAEDPIRYALAYAAYRAGRLKLAETYLGPIRDPKIFRQASELRRIVKECEQEPWHCS